MPLTFLAELCFRGTIVIKLIYDALSVNFAEQ